MKNALKTYGLQSAEFIVLAVHVIVLGPILLAISLVRTGRPIKRYVYLFQRNVLASYFRARIDFRFGGFHSCARRLNIILGTLEDQLPNDYVSQQPGVDPVVATPRPRDQKVFAFPGMYHAHAQTLPDLTDEQIGELAPIIAVYANLALCYFKMGAVEGACQVIIRAHNKIGIQALPTLLDLDHQASQIVLASLAACRILENGGTATVVVKEAPGSSMPEGSSSGVERSVRSSADSAGQDASSPRSNVIPFPKPLSRS